MGNALTRLLLLLLLTLLALWPADLAAQKQPSKKPKTGCPIAVDQVDPFDSLRTVASEPIILGHRMLSQYETENGPTVIPEAKAVMLFSENDTLNGFFLVLVLPEYDYKAVDQGFNVKVKLANDTIIGFYTFPDQGYFDKKTNMRHYTHTALLPMNQYYMLTTFPVQLLRVEYPKHRRTIELTAEQQQKLMEAARCVGERVGMYPINP